MGENSAIQWTDHTFNLWTGCSKISPGCANCYAAALPPSMRRGATWGDAAQRVIAPDAYWRQPLTWNRAAAKAGKHAFVFCASVADWAEDRPELDAPRERLFELIGETPWLVWLLLTKRAHVLPRYAEHFARHPNAWAGVSVENQEQANARIPYLLGVPASRRFLSMEPLLGAVNARHMDVENHPAARALSPIGAYWIDALTGENKDMGRPCPSVRRIDWVIVGGESGRRARPMHPDWARSIRDQCESAGVPFFFKQFGEWSPTEQQGVPSEIVRGGRPGPWSPASAIPMWRVGKAAAGRILDGREHNDRPSPLEVS